MMYEIFTLKMKNGRCANFPMGVFPETHILNSSLVISVMIFEDKFHRR
jgi:hypothetical protein